MSPPEPVDVVALPASRWGHRLARRHHARRALQWLAAGVLTWVVSWAIWRGYRQPGLLIDLANAMLFC